MAQTIFLSDAETRAVFDWADAIEVMRQSYASDLTEEMFPPRAMARGHGLWLRTMTGVSPDTGLMGGKMIAANMANQVASYPLILIDQQTCQIDAMMDGASVTGFRTAATSALAAGALAGEESWRIAMIGSGFEAQNHVRALAALRKPESVTVFSPNPDSRQRFICELADLDIPVLSASSAQEAVEAANIIICAARSHDESPVLLGEWLRPGMTVLSIGSTLPEQREVDPETIRRADLIVSDMVEEVVHDTGDMIAATKAGISFANRITSLAEVISGKVTARRSADQIMLYKSVGGAQQDLAIAAMCVRRARERGLGSLLPAFITPIQKGKK
ncbi:MAG: ornithine cyclodeaminase family protein [Sphingomonadaceae bacterium]